MYSLYIYILIQAGSTLDEMKDPINKHPHIIAYGLSPDNILHYYIEVENELIDVKCISIFQFSISFVNFVNIVL